MIDSWNINSIQCTKRAVRGGNETEARRKCRRSERMQHLLITSVAISASLFELDDRTKLTVQMIGCQGLSIYQVPQVRHVISQSNKAGQAECHLFGGVRST